MKHPLEVGYPPIPRRKTDSSGWMCFADKEKEESEQKKKRRVSNQKHKDRQLTWGITDPPSAS